MAASSSDDSSTPPKDFHLSSSIDSGSRLSPNKHKCPLCHNFKKNFYCNECVQNGGFYHSKSKVIESYADKQKTLLELKSKNQKLESRCMELLDKPKRTINLLTDIRLCKDRIESLQKNINEKQKKCIEYEEVLSGLEKHIEKRTAYQIRCTSKVHEVEQFVEDERERLIINRKILEEKKKEVKELVKIKIDQLSTYIFPISIVQPKEESESSESELVQVLAEASQSSDLRGSWEYTENCGEMCYKIVAPTLPASGNYTCYNMWLAQNKEGNNLPTSSTDHRNHAFSISAALSYTTQFLHLISYYLDIPLPFKVFHSDFSSRELTEQQFNTRVARLNANILYLCYTQNINLDSLRSCQTIPNLLQLVDINNEDLGNIEPVELDDEKVEALERPLVCDLQKNDDSDSDEGSSFLVDWEALPNIQYPEIPAGPANVQVSQMMNTQQASSVAGGLVNSAAASIASLWKGFTGR